MCQIPQVAEHAGVLDGALLARLVALILGVWADKGKDSLQNGSRQLEPRREHLVPTVAAVPVPIAVLALVSREGRFVLPRGAVGWVLGIAVVVELGGLGWCRLLAPAEELLHAELHCREEGRRRIGRPGNSRFFPRVLHPTRVQGGAVEAG